jgi:hypothetical protein
MCVIVISFLLSSPLRLHNPLVVDSAKDLRRASFEDWADLGQNVFPRARCESGPLALLVNKQEEVAGCTLWRMSRMGNLVGFDSGDLLSRSFGIVS